MDAKSDFLDDIFKTDISIQSLIDKITNKHFDIFHYYAKSSIESVVELLAFSQPSKPVGVADVMNLLIDIEKLGDLLSFEYPLKMQGSRLMLEEYLRETSGFRSAVLMAIRDALT